MRFSNKVQRNQHPQARLIPETVWSEIFRDNSFPEFLIPLMDMSNEELIEHLPSLECEEREKAWIGIVFSHSTMQNNHLIDIGVRLGLSISELLNLSVMLGDTTNHLDLLMSLAQQELYSDSVFERYLSRIEKAAQFGHLNVLSYLIGIIESNASHDLNTVKAFKLAASNGHLDVLNYLEEKAPCELQEMIAAGTFDAFLQAVCHGHLDVLKYLAEKAPRKLQEMIAAYHFDAFQQAAFHGHLDVLRYTEEKSLDKLQEMLVADTFDAFRCGSFSDHLDMLDCFGEKALDKF